MNHNYLIAILFIAVYVTIWQWNYVKNKLMSIGLFKSNINSVAIVPSGTVSTSATSPSSSFGTRSNASVRQTLRPTIPLSSRPYDSYVKSGACSSCSSSGGCNCPGIGNKAQTLIQRQKEKNVMYKVGGNALKQKIKQGNRLPATVMKAGMASNATTPGLTSDDPGDFTEYMKNNSINPDTITSHKKYVQESKMFSQQPAKPSDAIESNYGNYWGIGRRNFKPPAEDALYQYGANDEDYDTNWSFNFG